jgi:hypothetical protein
MNKEDNNKWSLRSNLTELEASEVAIGRIKDWKSNYLQDSKFRDQGAGAVYLPR